MSAMPFRRTRSERGTALLEAAVTLPILLLVGVGIFEFGRAFQTWQVVTNAAREGARFAVMPSASDGAVVARVRSYLESGQLPQAGSTPVVVNRSATLTVNGINHSASQVTVNYPFQFLVLQPIARLVQPNTPLGAPVTISATALMRNEAP